MLMQVRGTQNASCTHLTFHTHKMEVTTLPLSDLFGRVRGDVTCEIFSTGLSTH